MKMVLGIVRPEMAMHSCPKEMGPNVMVELSLDSPRLDMGLFWIVGN